RERLPRLQSRRSAASGRILVAGAFVSRPPTAMTPALTESNLKAATGFEKAAWLLMVGGLLFVFWSHLVPALVAGLLVNVLLQRRGGGLARRLVSHGAAKVLAAVVTGLVAVGVTTASLLLIIALVRGHLGDIPATFGKMAEVLDETVDWLQQRGWGALVP